MGTLDTWLVGACIACASGVLLVFVLYPATVLVAGRARRAGTRLPPSVPPTASLIVALRNAGELADAKVANSLALRAPRGLELVFVSDGSSDDTVERLRALGGERLRRIELPEHRGKAAALDEGVRHATGEVLVFSDADALLEPDALEHLLARFADPAVGGVCGQRVLGERAGELVAAQEGYIAADSALKRAESRLGSVSANDGKLYAIRRALYRPIEPGATDDLFACLSVVEQGRRFVFEPRARAHVRTPSRSPAHELARRRRIVARSLHGIARKRALLNPLRHGFFAVQLLVNKVFRRLLPLFLAGLLATAALLARAHPAARLLLAGAAAFTLLALARRVLARVPLLGRASGLAHYFLVGNLGTLLGLLDFGRGRVTVRWDPVKEDR